MDIFNATQKAIASYYPDILEDIKRARIFYFDGPNYIDAIFNHEHPKDSFYLPYPVTAIIVGENDMMIMVDNYKNQVGFKEPRLFMNCCIVKPSAYDSDMPLQREGEILSISRGVMVDSEKEDNDAIKMGFFDFTFFVKNERIFYVKENEIDKGIKKGDDKLWQLMETMKKRFSHYFSAIAAINNPDTFILEKTPISPKKKQKPGKRLRLRHERPEYTILHPNKIRKRMCLPQIAHAGKGTGKRPHERRRHEKFLSADKYKFGKDGSILDPKIIPYGPRKGEPYYKKIIQPAIWIGPKENVVGNHRYRVILDR